MSKKYNINGREVELYQINDDQLVAAYNHESDSQTKAEMAESIAGRLSRYAKRSDESNSERVGRVLEDMVNSTSCHPDEVAKRMARSHRYLQGEMFRICLSFVKELATAYEKGWYDGRNEWACEMAAKMSNALD